MMAGDFAPITTLNRINRAAALLNSLLMLTRRQWRSGGFPRVHSRQAKFRCFAIAQKVWVRCNRIRCQHLL